MSTLFENGPFPVALIGGDGKTIQANHAWNTMAHDELDAVRALGLIDDDLADFVDTLTTVRADLHAAWIDLYAHALKEQRWVRCHLWPTSDEVAVAVVPIRETRNLSLSREQIEHIEKILEHTADAIAIVNPDLSIRFASGIATRWLGISGSSYEGEDALGFIFADDHPILIDAFSRCLNEPLMSVKARFRVVHDGGDLIWVEAIGTNMIDDPAIAGLLVTLNDITELVDARSAAESNKAALEAEKLHFETLAQFIPTGVFELSHDDQLLYRNERFDQLMSLPAEAGFDWDLFDPRDREALKGAISKTRTGKPTQSTVRLAHPFPHGERWLTIRAVRQGNDRILASIEDATTHLAKQAELAHRADHDDLTGLPNRESLLEHLREFIAADEPLAVLFLDLDHFKDINDGLGHQVGDQVLIEIADRIETVVRPGDIVGRLHGDEFLVVCRHTSELATAREIAERVVQAVGEPLDTGARELVVSGSIGIAINTDPRRPNATPEELLVAADIAMYEAKRRGGARSVPFNRHLGKRAADRLRLHGEVQRAGDLNELVLHYQPIVDLETRTTARHEALVRWHHPTQGFILPDRFIPDIEQSGLIDELGRWIVERVIRDLAEAGADPTPVNVNVSPRQLASGVFADMVLELLETHDVPGSLLTVEITELVMMADFAPAERQLKVLQQHGVGIAMDDFGTGYSALAYLQRFPFDQIKIDGAFVAEIESDRNQSIVGSMVRLITDLGATPIAEMVERQQQVDELIRLGCPLGQGFYLGRPEPLDE